MLIKKPSDIKSSEITPESVYRNRRQFMMDGGQLLLGAAMAGAAPAFAQDTPRGDQLKARAPAGLRRSPPAKHIRSAWRLIKCSSLKRCRNSWAGARVPGVRRGDAGLWSATPSAYEHVSTHRHHGNCISFEKIRRRMLLWISTLPTADACP